MCFYVLLLLVYAYLKGRIVLWLTCYDCLWPIITKYIYRYLETVTSLINSHIAALLRSDSNATFVISNEHSEHTCLCFLDAITTTYLSLEWVYLTLAHIFTLIIQRAC